MNQFRKCKDSCVELEDHVKLLVGFIPDAYFGNRLDPESILLSALAACVTGVVGSLSRSGDLTCRFTTSGIPGILVILI